MNNKKESNFFQKIGKWFKDFFVKGDQQESGFIRFIKSDGFKSVIASLICVVVGLLIGILVIVIVNAENAPKAISRILKGGFNAEYLH